MATPIGIDPGQRPPDRFATKIGKAVRSIFRIEDGTQPGMSDYNDAPSSTGGDGASGSVTHAAVSKLWQVHNERKAVYEEIERMDTLDEFVNTGLDIIADCTVSYNEDVSKTQVAETDEADEDDDSGPRLFIYTKDKDVDRIIKDCIRRAGIRDAIWHIARDTAKEGTHFREIVVDRGSTPNKIVDLKTTVQYRIYPNENSKGQKIWGWWERTEADVFTDRSGKKLEEWQILPFEYGRKMGNLCVPFLTSARRNWLRLFQIEDGMAGARILRAYDKLLHRVPIEDGMTTGEVMATLQRYRNNIVKRKVATVDGFVTQTENPEGVQTDFFVPDKGDKRGGIDVLASNNLQLSNLEDVYYGRERLLARIGVPMGYYQIMSTQKTHLRAGSAMSDIDKQFARRVRSLQRALIKGLRKVFDLELVLNGIAPTPGLYRLALSPITTKDLLEDANVELKFAQAAVYYIEAFGALPFDILTQRFLRSGGAQYDRLMTFFKGIEKRVVEARVKSLETAAEPNQMTKDRLPGDNRSGAGNNNKSRAKRSSEQKGGGGTSQSELAVPLHEAVNAFMELHQTVHAEAQRMFPDTPDLPTNLRAEVTEKLLGLADEEFLEP